jgi:hypothetical protein
MVFQNSYATSVEFTSHHNSDAWILTNVYALCTPQGKREFIQWFKKIHMPKHVDWIIVEDFITIVKGRDGGLEGVNSPL